MHKFMLYMMSENAWPRKWVSASLNSSRVFGVPAADWIQSAIKLHAMKLSGVDPDRESSAEKMTVSHPAELLASGNERPGSVSSHGCSRYESPAQHNAPNQK